MMAQREFSAPLVMENIHQYMVKELAPFRTEIIQFWLEVSELDITVSESLLGRSTPGYTDRYRSLNRRWANLREKAIDLNALISPDDPHGVQKVAELLSQPALLEAIRRDEADVSVSMRDIGTALRDLRTEANFKRSSFYSILAIGLASASIAISVILKILL